MTQKKKLPVIAYVVVCRDDDGARELGGMLWSVLAEVSVFYNLDKPRGEFKRWWLGNNAPTNLTIGNSDHIVTRKLGDKWWEPLQSSSSWLIDQERLAKAVRELIPQEEGRIIVVTDEEITPPPEWRYIIWDGSLKGAGVASLAPLDPRYWGDRTPDREQIIKRRIRAALLSMTGTRLGFQRCNNTRCYLYANVDSVTALDVMIALGHEHEQEGLSDKVFSGRIDEEAGFEVIADQPKASYEFER